MVGNNDGGSTGLGCSKGTLDGHDAFDDKRLPGLLNNLVKLLGGLASCGRSKTLKERKTCCIDIHGNRKGSGLLNHAELLLKRVNVPRLDRGNASAVICLDGSGGSLDYVGVRAVAREGNDAGLCSGGNQNVIVLNVVVLIAVVEFYCADGACHHRDAKILSEEAEGGIRLLVLCDRVHVDTDLLPGFIVADGNVSDALGSRSRHDAAAGTAVADGTGFAEGAAAGPCVFKYFLICHVVYLRNECRSDLIRLPMVCLPQGCRAQNRRKNLNKV